MLAFNDCGAYISFSCSIVGIVKQRFSDFVVNEIDMKGEVVRLTSTSTEECNRSSQKHSLSSNGADDDQQCPIPAETLVLLIV